MINKRFLITSAAAFAIALAGAISAEPQDGAPMPASVKDPTSDSAKQAKTEQMLKEEKGGLTGDQGGEMPSEVTKATPDTEAQAKTEEMLKEEKGGLQGR